MLRFRELTTETAGFYNTVGFNDDTRAFLSIPARHDVARRVDCASWQDWWRNINWTKTSSRGRPRPGLRSGAQGIPAMSLYCREGGPDAEPFPRISPRGALPGAGPARAETQGLAVPPDGSRFHSQAGPLTQIRLRILRRPPGLRAARPGNPHRDDSGGAHAHVWGYPSLALRGPQLAHRPWSPWANCRPASSSSNPAACSTTPGRRK